MSDILEITIPGDIQPIERGERFDLPLCDLFDEIGGDIVGSGSRLSGSEILECVLELAVPNLEIALPRIIRILQEGNAPSGTEVVHVGLGRKRVYPSSEAGKGSGPTLFDT
jgi:hypothetical protein